MNLDDYVLERVNSGKEVKIKIKLVKRKTNGIKHEDIDWLIDNKFVLEDMPLEVFEGEELVKGEWGK